METASFEPTEESKQILLALEIANMQWIADEIREVIRHGKIEEPEVSIPGKNGRSRTLKGHRVVPLDPLEQMEQIVQTIWVYTRELQEMWEWSNHELTAALNLAPSPIALLSDAGESEYALFPQEFREEVYALHHLLRELAPNVVDE